MRTRRRNGTFAHEGDVNARFDSYVEPEPMSGCFLWTGSTKPKGYGTFMLHGKTTAAHRYAFARAFGAVPDGHVVMHSCDVPACVNPAHLRVGTIGENNADRDEKGRHKPLLGEKHGMHKLTEGDVLRILHAGEPAKVVAGDLGISMSNVFYIRAGKGWKHLRYTPDRLGECVADLRVMFAKGD